MKNIPENLKKKSSYVAKRFMLCRRLVLESQPKKILDIGCSDGLFLSLINNDIEKHGIDLFERFNGSQDIVYKKHDVSTGIPYKDSSFDVVVSMEVIEHLVDTESFLKECSRILRTGGRVIISTPNLHYWRNLVEWFKGNQFFFIDYHEGQEGHVRYFCPRTLRELADKSGFKNIRTRTTGDWRGDNALMRRIGLLFEIVSRNKNLILVLDAIKE